MVVGYFGRPKETDVSMPCKLSMNFALVFWASLLVSSPSTVPLDIDSGDLALLLEKRLPKPGETLPGGWAANGMMSAVLDAHAISGDRHWLDEMARLSRTALSMRGVATGRINYAGVAAPQWYRSERDTIFWNSYVVKYDPAAKDAIMADRRWRSLNMSDVNHDGLFLEPMLEFAKLARATGRDAGLVTEIVTAAEQSVASHEREWVPDDSDRGHYIFPKGSPFFMDGAEMPVNEAAIFGTSLVLLYELTGKPEYLNRAESMFRHWTDNITYTDGVPNYPYAIGNWAKGWTASEGISINTPDMPPNLKDEGFYKANLTINFAIHLSAHRSSQGLTRFLAAVPTTLAKAADKPLDQIEFLPSYLSLAGMTDTYYVRESAQWNGWVRYADASPRAWRQMYLLAMVNYQQYGKPETLLALTRFRPREVRALPSLTVQTLYLRPYQIGAAATECLFEVDEDTIAEIAYRPSTPKDPTLFLRPTPDFDGRGIRLPKKPDGVYRGRAMLKPGDCPRWQWLSRGRPEISQPTEGDPPVIGVTLYTLADQRV